MSNKDTYESCDVVRCYSMAENLQKPEQNILTSFGDKIKNMKMLDIGVGGGRTTIYFAKLAKEYVGIDYSDHMIEACKKRFSGEGNISFKLADVRELRDFKDNDFDLVLFSFNGLDYINHQDRIKALKEIKRVLKKGGVFVFSSHNLNCINKVYSIKFYKNPITLIRRIMTICFLLLLNGCPKRLQEMEWAIINDGAHRFRLKTYYITPAFQIQQLKNTGFEDIQLFSLDSGEEIKDSNLRKVNDTWIYYKCVA